MPYLKTPFYKHCYFLLENKNRMVGIIVRVLIEQISIVALSNQPKLMSGIKFEKTRTVNPQATTTALRVIGVPVTIIAFFVA